MLHVYDQVMVEDITQHTSRIDLQSNPVKRVRSLVDQVSIFDNWGTIITIYFYLDGRV